MNPLIILVALAVGYMVWVLVVSLKRGEFSYQTRGTTMPGGISRSRVRKSERPGVFWTLAAFHLGLLLYLVSLAFQLE